MTLGQRINARRLELGMTLQQVATQAGSSKSYIWEIEMTMQEKIARAICLSLNGSVGKQHMTLAGTPGEDWWQYLPTAEAVLEAMMIPTDGMIRHVLRHGGFDQDEPGEPLTSPDYWNLFIEGAMMEEE